MRVINSKNSEYPLVCNTDKSYRMYGYMLRDMYNKITSEYRINTNQLVSSLRLSDLEKFTNKTHTKYLSLIKKEVVYKKKLEWVLRHMHSAKKIMLSSLFYNQAIFLTETKAKNLAFYSMYYSLLNAMIANIFLLPYLSFENVSRISHKKVFSLIDNYFVRKNLFPQKSLSLLSELKMWRESYSYHLPLTGSNPAETDLLQRLENTLPIIIQSAELLSYTNYFAWDKRVETVIDNYSETQVECDDMFFSLIKIKDDFGEHFNIDDDDDYHRQGYLMNNSKSPMPISWFVTEKLCEDLECNWEQQETDNDFNINAVGQYIADILSC